MAIQVYNFNKFDGYAQVNDHPEQEFRIYFNGNSNTLATICNRLKDSNAYYLYNVITGTEHLKTLRKEKYNWFEGISGLILYIDKLTPDITKFLNYALECKVKVTLLDKPDWGQPI